MAKQIIKYKVIRQSAEMGSKFYGVVNNADPISAELTMEQIIDKRKLHNYSAKQLTVLMEEVLQGAAELVARDGMPRNLSTLLKFEARIRGTFANTESGITDQIVLVKPRMLKDIKVDIDKSNFTFVNESGDTSPKISSLAQESDDFAGWDLTAFKYVGPGRYEPHGALTVAGVRLAPSGWTSDCHWSIAAVRGNKIFRFDHITDPLNQNSLGMWGDSDVASDNTLKFSVLSSIGQGLSSWIATTYDPTVAPSAAWVPDPNEPDDPHPSAEGYVPTAGDRLVFTFARDLGDGSGSVVMASKEYVLA